MSHDLSGEYGFNGHAAAYFVLCNAVRSKSQTTSTRQTAARHKCIGDGSSNPATLDAVCDQLMLRIAHMTVILQVKTSKDAK